MYAAYNQQQQFLQEQPQQQQPSQQQQKPPQQQQPPQQNSKIRLVHLQQQPLETTPSVKNPPVVVPDPLPKPGRTDTVQSGTL